MAADGAAAEYVIAPAEILAPAPTSIPLPDAAALPMVGLTAWQALFDHAKLTAGQRVLINGAGGAVGGYAVQLAKNAGAYVIATASPRSSEQVRTAGADEVIDHTTTEVTSGDRAGRRRCSTSRRSTRSSWPRWSPWSVPAASWSNTVWMPAPADEERGVRGIDLFVRSDAEQLVRAGGAGRPRRAARRRRPAGAAGRTAGGPRPGRRRARCPARSSSSRPPPDARQPFRSGTLPRSFAAAALRRSSKDRIEPAPASWAARVRSSRAA